MTSPQQKGEQTWRGEEFWIDLIEKQLYPPEAQTKYRAIKQIVSSLDLRGKKLLDHGCGTGVLGVLAQERGAHVQGIDISEVLVQEARKRIPAERADMNALPFADETFDVVLSAMVLHIVKDIEIPLKEIQRVLRKGGTCIIGIVHPFSEKWDLVNGRPYSDSSTYVSIEQRTWLFNLENGEQVTATYYHRPLSAWVAALLPLFNIEEILEPELDSQYLSTGKYARNEYIFFNLAKH
jgi:ubiquinone/menaquinone biosynthesis C-methylase UbiE